MPKVSIIVPVYNAQNAIKRCIDSILEQEYEDFELLLMDDGSKDNSPKILDEYQKKDNRVNVVHKQNSGVSDTRNKAIEMAKGEYIQFLDADDWMTKDSTKELVRAMETNNADMVIADFYRVVGENLSKKGSIISNKALTLKEYAEYLMDSPADYYYGVIWNKLYKKSIIEQYHLKMDASLSFCEDFIFNMEYLLHCKTIYPLQIPIYYYVKTEGSLVSQNASLSKLVKMKTDVFQYYDSFFRNVFNEEEYREERASIVKFLVMPATDDFAIPLMPGTKKVGEEIDPIYLVDENNLNLLSVTYYIRKIYERYLNTLAIKYKLDLRDIKIIDSIYQYGNVTSIKQISDYTDISESIILVSLQVLRIKGYVVFNSNSRGVTIKLTKEANQICQDLHQAIQDLYSICLKDFDKKTLEAFENSIHQMNESLKEYIHSEF